MVEEIFGLALYDFAGFFIYGFMFMFMMIVVIFVTRFVVAIYQALDIKIELLLDKMGANADESYMRYERELEDRRNG